MAKGKFVQWLTREGLLKIQGWARDGLTDEQVAKNMGISRSTLNLWREKYSDISDALKEGKEVADRIVENALFKSAQGYMVKVKKPIKIHVIEYASGSGKKRKEYDKIVQSEEEQWIPGQVTAQIFWLKNRKPEKWREKPVDETVDNNVTIKWEEAEFAD